MSTRSGDLDPGVLVYLLEEEGVRPSTLNEMVNRKSGLLRVSRISSDMKDLLDKEKEEPHAAAAVNLFLLKGSSLPRVSKTYLFLADLPIAYMVHRPKILHSCT